MATSRLRSIGAATSVAAPRPEEELVRQLRDGEIDRETYFAGMVELCVAPMRERLTADRLQIVREQMREELETNPVFIKMLEDAMGERSERIG